MQWPSWNFLMWFSIFFKCEGIILLEINGLFLTNTAIWDTSAFLFDFYPLGSSDDHQGRNNYWICLPKGEVERCSISEGDVWLCFLTARSNLFGQTSLWAPSTSHLRTLWTYLINFNCFALLCPSFSSLCLFLILVEQCLFYIIVFIL